MEKIKYNDIFSSTLQQYPNNNAFIICKNGSYEIYTYKMLGDIAQEMYKDLQEYMKSNSVIGVLINHHPVLLPIMHTIHKSDCSFIFLNPEQIQANKEIIQYLKINFLFSLSPDIDYDDFIHKDCSYTTSVLKCNLFLWTKTNGCDSLDIRNISYCIRTSGSTGQPKYVAVPHRCIYPNVTDLESIFHLNSNDVIYFSTPLTFDPSIIELYLAAKSGSALMISSLDSLFLSDGPNMVTIWQTTPSKFLLLGRDAIENVALHEKSSLRVLALGGEPFHCDLKQLKHVGNRTEIFNLYGITEVSCWASVNRIEGFDCGENLNLGRCLSETMMEIDQGENEGDILIGSSTRTCFIDSEIFTSSDKKFDSKVIWRRTGDIGLKMNNKIYFRGRSAKFIKRFGHKVDLQAVEVAALNYEGTEQCSCIWDSKIHSLVLFYTGKSLDKRLFINHLKKSLNDCSIPDNLIHIESMPLNSHGKVSAKRLFEIYNNLKTHNEVKSFKCIFSELLREYLEFFNENALENKSFYDIGGTSILAALLVNKLENITSKTFSHLYSSMLDSNHPISSIISDFGDDKIEIKNNLQLKPTDYTNDSSKTIPDDDCIEIAWKYDTKKCVDANPVIFTDPRTDRSCVIVGSHSGTFVVLDLLTGSEIFQLNVNSRIEAPAFVFYDGDDSYTAFGCYDGSFYSISLFEKKINWRLSLEGMIKSRACAVKSRNICVATYKGFLHEIEPKCGEVISSTNISSKGISADLISSNDCVYVGCLDGRCSKVDYNQTEPIILWMKALESPVFAKPLLMKGDSQVVFSEVNCKIHCFDVETGNVIWTFDEAAGLLFSSCTPHFEDYLIFGCHDRHTYKLATSAGSAPRTLWRTRAPSEVYASPCILGEGGEYVASFCTRGNLQVIDIATGVVKTTFAMPGEVFSSPCCHFERRKRGENSTVVVVGCRDDNVYCLRIRI